MIKGVHVAALVKSLEDFDPLVKLLEQLGLQKSYAQKDERLRWQEFLPPLSTLEVIALQSRDKSAGLTIVVSDPDSAVAVIEKLGLEILDDDSGPDPQHLTRNFRVKLPRGTSVSIIGYRPVYRAVDSADVEHLSIEGDLRGSGKHFALVISRFNSFITERLLSGAIDGLVRSGVERRDGYDIIRVPGAFEIPSAARTAAETRKYEAIICLGCLLRGDTAHYDVIVNEVTRGIGQSAQETGVPHAFGVLTCDTLEQAIDRAGLKMGNKGFEAALAAVEMANLTSSIRRPASGLRKAASKKQIPRFARNDKTKSAKTKRRK